MSMRTIYRDIRVCRSINCLKEEEVACCANEPIAGNPPFSDCHWQSESGRRTPWRKQRMSLSSPTSHREKRAKRGHRGRIVCLSPDQFPDLFFDLVHFGETIEGALGKDLLPVQEDLKRSRFTGGDRHGLQLIVVVVQQVLRQTGSSSKVSSGGAVLDPYRWLLSIRGFAGDILSHCLASIRLCSSQGFEPVPQ